MYILTEEGRKYLKQGLPEKNLIELLKKGKLSVEETKGKEAEEGGKTVHYCIECAQEKGYAYYKADKDEKILTVFPVPEL